MVVELSATSVSLRAAPPPSRLTQRPWSRRNSSVWPLGETSSIVGRADAADRRLDPGPVAAHRVDVGVGARPAAALAAAVGDAAGEVARRELVDLAGAGEPGQSRPRGPHRVDVVGDAAAGSATPVTNAIVLPVGRERRLMLVGGGRGQGVEALAGDVDRVEVAGRAGGGAPLEHHVVAVGGELGPGVDLRAAGQSVLAAAVGPHRVDVAVAGERDQAAVGGEVRLAVGGVVGQLVEAAVAGGEQAAFDASALSFRLFWFHHSSVRLFFRWRGVTTREKTTAPPRRAAAEAAAGRARAKIAISDENLRCA